jgi:hypothetical protein
MTKAPPLMGQTPNTMHSYCLRRGPVLSFLCTVWRDRRQHPGDRDARQLTMRLDLSGSKKKWIIRDFHSKYMVRHQISPNAWWGSVARSRCAAAHPLHAGLAARGGPLLLKRQCVRTLGRLRRDHAPAPRGGRAGDSRQLSARRFRQLSAPVLVQITTAETALLQLVPDTKNVRPAPRLDAFPEGRSCSACAR